MTPERRTRPATVHPALAGGGIGAGGGAQYVPSAVRVHTRPGGHGVRGSQGNAQRPSRQAPETHSASAPHAPPTGASVAAHRGGDWLVSQRAPATQSKSVEHVVAQ